MKLTVQIIPSASKNKILKVAEKEYKIWITSAPVDGKANEAVVLAEALGLKPRSPRGSPH